MFVTLNISVLLCSFLDMAQVVLFSKVVLATSKITSVMFLVVVHLKVGGSRGLYTRGRRRRGNGRGP